MLLYRGGKSVVKGTFWDIKNGARVDVCGQQDLPGGGDVLYLQVSPLIMLLMGPIFGLLYVVFLPVASILMVAILAAKRIIEGLVCMVSKLAYFEWRPAESYLAGKKEAKKDENKDESQGKE